MRHDRPNCSHFTDGSREKFGEKTQIRSPPRRVPMSRTIPRNDSEPAFEQRIDKLSELRAPALPPVHKHDCGRVFRAPNSSSRSVFKLKPLPLGDELFLPFWAGDRIRSRKPPHCYFRG